MRTLSFVIACLVAASVAWLGPRAAHAALALGAFGSGQAWTPGFGVATDGSSFFIGGLTYPVPGALRPTTPFTFSLSAPTSSILYATELDGSCGGASAARVFYYGVVPDDATTGHLAPITTFCVPHGIAFDGYILGTQQIAWVAEISQPSDSTQSMHWVDLGSGDTGTSQLTRDIDDNLGFPLFSPSVTVAFTREVPAMSTTATYHLVDLCPATLGHVLNPGGGMLANLPAPEPTAQVLDTGGGHFVARVSHPSLPGGRIDVVLTDCLSAPSTTTTTVATSSTIASTVTTTSTTTTTLPPVVTTTDPYAPGGLLEVIGRVNAGQPGPITFALPGVGPYVIDLGLSTVFVTTPMTIDGTTQSSHGAPLVQIHNGQFEIRAPGCTIQGLAIDDGIFVTPPADSTLIQNNYLGIAPDGVTGNGTGGTAVSLGTQHNTVQGNVIEGSVTIGEQVGHPPATDNLVRANLIGTNAAGAALVSSSFVVVNSANNVIGGTGPGDGNVIAGGVSIGDFQPLPSSASGALVAGNFIGIDASGTKVLGGSVVGVGISRASHNTIGPNNVVSGEVLIQGGGGNTVKGNLIGTDATGTRALVQLVAGVPYPGIEVLNSSDNVIGGTAAADRNVIAAHASTVHGGIVDGILILGNTGTPAERNVILGNFVGTDITGTQPLPNDVGIEIVNAVRDTTIGGTDADAGNLIAFNRSGGVRISGSPASGNTVAGNSIDRNGSGIEVSNGANDNIAAPVLTRYTGGSTSTFVGHATGPPNAPLTIEFFANPAGDGEGRTFCGRKTYMADAHGDVTFSESFACVTNPSEAAAGTATATDAAGNTSEFSLIPGGTTTSTTIGTSTTTTTTLPLDSVAGVRQAIATVVNTLTAPPQPECTSRCRCASLPTVIQRVTSFVDKAQAATKPKPCKRALGSAHNAAKGFQKHVASLIKRGCLAPQSRGPILAQQAADLLGRIAALRQSTYCTGK